ncbi:NAD(P)H-dependent oxidoreductase [Undibacterium sp. 5I1]|uniref:flavodoxin family protein n=1 Tax=unclassified Undibacterium TaxID=2630295 RepID=UPI002AB3E49E|nr:MULTISPECIES: NAD(P)H-dependent oxidoreductase [unclassified Undibacterium]MDY7539350.1 NAD(P)H-dependent oxidoreductase [Undibacterium sp. 5I1]MEB0231177.1 NAD(P)H-dependent oxidoreductase [Undibacterium sp. 10I3]MEB0258541.1 NAD(P)H-dependent oxidoreductase [Undibacterium sp. 5I1]
MSTVIILGSARNQGNTHQLASYVANDIAATLFNLSDYEISPYEYEHRNRDDDFLLLMNEVLKFEHIILASPIYWYAPSSVMKVFLDRLSDLITIEKSLGRKLRDKSGSVIATGCDLVPPPCFEQMFQLTYRYLGIDYREMLYCPCIEDIEIHQHHLAINTFIRKSYAK